jgi:hypothetical protein
LASGKGGKGGKGGKAISGKNKKTPQSKSARAGLQVNKYNHFSFLSEESIVY